MNKYPYTVTEFSTDSTGSTDSKKEERRKRKEKKKKEKLDMQCSFEFQRDVNDFIPQIDISKEEEKILEKMENGDVLSNDETVIYDKFIIRSNPAEILKQDVKDYINQFSEIREKMKD